MRHLPSVALFVVSALALSACGGASETDEVAIVDPMAPTVELSAIQQASFERLNREEVQAEFATIIEGLGEATPGKAERDFGWLDRNEDGKLDVAEFALFELGAMTAGAPVLTEQQISEVASVFFLNDVDGDQLMSETEFASASGQPGPEELSDEKTEQQG